MKKTSLVIMLLTVCVTLQAALLIDSQKKYRLRCLLYTGYVQVGAEHDVDTPLYHSTTDEDSADAYWTFTRVDEGIYTMRNAKTGQYVAYTGEYTGSNIRYIGLKDALDGANTQWEIEVVDDALSIRSVANPSHRFNVRSNSPHVVGTYSSSGTPGANELFMLYDEEGNIVSDQTTDTSNPQYGTTVNGYFWENTGLAMPVVLTTDKDNPILYAIQSPRSQRYVSVSDDGRLTQSENLETRFFFMQSGGAGGVVVYTEDGERYVSGEVPHAGSDIANSSLTLLSGAPADGDHTWDFAHYAGSAYSGYTIGIENCEANQTAYEDSPYYWDGYRYWNDYYSNYIGFYVSDDPGNPFIFYSNDTRHRDMLKEQGILVPEPGEISVQDPQAWFETLKIGDKTPAYDKLYKTYMLPLGRDYSSEAGLVEKVTYSLASVGKYTVCIDDSIIESGATYDFADVSGGKTYALSVRNANNQTIAAASLTFTFLPIVEITGTTFASNYYLPGTLRLIDPDTQGGDTIMNATFRHRGATAASKQKKSYAVKLKDNAGNAVDKSFLQMRDDNNWILDAMAIDPARMRNRVSTDLWNDFATAPYHKHEEPEALSGTRGRFVEVLLNGSYAGIYCLTEKIDRKQLKLKKIKPAAVNSAENDTIRGILYKSVSWSYSVFMGHYTDVAQYPMSTAANYSNSRGTWDSWEMKYPDLDDGEEIDWEPLYNAVNVVASYQNDAFRTNVADYFDLPVWRDYYLFVELMLATDNHGKNLYLYTYNKQKSPKMGLAPWDLDGTWGRRWDGSNSLTGSASWDYTSFITTYEHGQHTLYKRLSELDYDGWKEQLARRYAELRDNGAFSVDSLTGRFNRYFELFNESGAAAREVKRWNGKDVNLNFTTEKTYINNWITRRLAALDEAYGYEPTGISQAGGAGKFIVRGTEGGLEVESAGPCTVTVHTLSGMLVRHVNVERGITPISGLAPGIYIVNGRKVSIR